MTARLFKGVLPASVVASIAVLSMPAAAAQVECRVPFSFTVNEKTLPPGDYRVSTEVVQGVLSIRSEGDGAFALGTRLESRTETDAKLVFYKYGDEYVLRQVWMGDGDGRQLPRSPRERELMEKARSNETALTLERVAVPAL